MLSREFENLSMGEIPCQINYVANDGVWASLAVARPFSIKTAVLRSRFGRSGPKGPYPDAPCKKKTKD